MCTWWFRTSRWSNQRFPRSLLDSICTFVQKETDTEFMKSLSKKDDRIAQIEAYYHQLDASVASFQVCYRILAPVYIIPSFDTQISSLVNIQDWQRQNDEAQLKDQKILHNRLNELESNLNNLKEMFSMSIPLSYSHLVIICRLPC